MATSKLISKKVIDFLNLRIKQEEESARLYEQMSLFLTDEGYMNLGKLFRKYADKELVHADWAKKYLLDFGQTPALAQLV